MRFARRVFLIAGILGLIVLTPQLFLEARVGQDYPPAVTHPEFYYGFVAVGLAWQVLFLVVATDPARFRPVMIPALLEKFGFGAAVLALYLSQRVAAVVLGFALIDVLLGVLFVAAYVRTAPGPSPQPRKDV
jgi:hypothetical protein